VPLGSFTVELHESPLCPGIMTDAGSIAYTQATYILPSCKQSPKHIEQGKFEVVGENTLEERTLPDYHNKHKARKLS
jgi:hypothetical protein